tara:strand:- start:341 stop:565 length:225 start_codon:yes stop_codon:yes gene_type:complete
MSRIHPEWVESELDKMKNLLDQLDNGHDYDHHKVEEQFMNMVNRALEAYRTASIFNSKYVKTIDVGKGILTVQS